MHPGPMIETIDAGLKVYWKDVYIYEYVEGRLAYLDTFFANPYVDELE